MYFDGLQSFYIVFCNQKNDNLSGVDLVYGNWDSGTKVYQNLNYMIKIAAY